MGGGVEHPYKAPARGLGKPEANPLRPFALPPWTKAVYLLDTPRHHGPPASPPLPLPPPASFPEPCPLSPGKGTLAGHGGPSGGLWLMVTPVTAPTSSFLQQLMLQILGSDLAILLSGREAGDPSPPLGPSAPPLGGQPPPRPPTLPPEHPWLPLLQELARTQPRRLRGRAQKAAQLGCFGIKLDRIGTFSGLGC
ncbi:C-type natriuretic peptide 1-like [Crotalus adamanteus]|uniref:C-type natriuretic peptide 1-like n=1 Tax=Crotalus adamanteus TaxID=8729 RepID=A0AAW1B8R5_CROAD